MFIFLTYLEIPFKLQGLFLIQKTVFSPLKFIVMLDQLFNLVKENAGDTVVNNPEVPNEHNEGVMKEAVGAITGGLQKELAKGGFENVLKTLGGNASATEENPVVNNISGNFMDSIMKKFGISSGAAKSIAATLIPIVMGKLIHKTNDPNDNSFGLDDIFSSLTGGKSSGLDLGGILGSLTGGGGLDQNKDGKVDLNDITGMLGGAAKNEQQRGDGMMGALKGIFGK